MQTINIENQIKVLLKTYLGVDSHSVKKLYKTDWLVTRHRDQRELGITTSISQGEYLHLLQLRQAWRDPYSIGTDGEIIEFNLDNLSAEPINVRPDLDDVKKYKIKFESGEIPPPIHVSYGPSAKNENDPYIWNPESNEKYFHIQDGHRRVQAAKELGLKTLPAIVWNFT